MKANIRNLLLSVGIVCGLFLLVFSSGVMSGFATGENISGGCGSAIRSETRDEAALVRQKLSKKFDPNSYRGDFASIAPGASGAFTVSSVHPLNENLIFVGTELNGIFRSVDGGDSWKNISLGIDSRQIYSIAINYNQNQKRRHYLFVGTTDGVYRSTSFVDSELGDNWTLMSTGFEAGCARGDGCETHHRYPVQTLSVVEGKPWLVWAGIGAVMLGNDISKYRPTDPWRVYRSKDAGKTWEGVLALEPNSDAAKVIGPVVYSIDTDSTQTNKALVASDVGLFITHDTGESWYELGIKEVQRGVSDLDTKSTSWSSCVGNEDCSSIYQTAAACSYNSESEPAGTVRSCLPISAETMETHPNIRYARMSNGYLYAMIFDSGWAGGIKNGSESFDTEQCLSTSQQANSGGDSTSSTLWAECLPNCDKYETKSDDELHFYRGGIWRSENGLKWTYIPPPEGRRHIRCRPDVELTSSASFPFFEVDPNNADHIVMGGSWVRGPSTGFYEYENGTWYDLRTVCHAAGRSATADSYACFEGNQTLGMWSETSFSMPDVYGLSVASWTPLTAYMGHIMGFWKIQKSEQASSGKPDYRITHLAQERYSNPSSRVESDYWRSTGADLHCPHAGVQFLQNPDGRSHDMFVGAIDVGVLKSKDGYWKKVTEENQYLIQSAEQIGVPPGANNIKLDNTRTMIVDNNTLNPSKSVLYANNDWANYASQSGNVNYMLRAKSPGNDSDWSNIGGVFYDSQCNELKPASDSSQLNCSGNGLPRSFSVNAMALDPYTSRIRHPGNRRLWVGTQGDGIYVYDPLSTEPQWSHLTGEGCEKLSFSEANRAEVWQILSLENHGYENLFLAAVADMRSSSDGGNGGGAPDARADSEGVFLIERFTPAGTPSYRCTRMFADAAHGRYKSCDRTAECQLGGSVGLLSKRERQRTCECNPMVARGVAMSRNTDDGLRLLSIGYYRNFPVVYGTDITPADLLAHNTSRLDWKIVLAFDDGARYGEEGHHGLTFAGRQWKDYIDGLDTVTKDDWAPEYYEYENFSRKEITSITSVDALGKTLLITMADTPTFEHHAARHVYKTTDGGYSFRVATEFENLPFRTLWRIDFSPKRKNIYLSGKCSSLYEGASPYADADGDGLMTMIDPEPARSNNWYWIGRKRRNSAPLEFSESISDRFVEGKETIDGTISVDGVTDKTQASGRLYSARRIGIVIDKSD